MLNEHQIKLIAASKFAYVEGEGWYRGETLIPNELAVKNLRKLVRDIGDQISPEEFEVAALSSKVLGGVDEAFITSSPYLRHFYWKSSGGTLAMYYSPTQTRELVPLQLTTDETHRPFLNALREVPEWLEMFLADFQRHRQSNKRLTVDAFATQLFKALIITPSQQLVDEPRSLSWDGSEFSFKHFDPGMLRPDVADTPSWDQFINRLSSPDLFLAFIWSIFEEKNLGRQVMWIKGPGNDGKSRVISAVSRFLGNRAVAALSQGTVSSQFFNSFVYGKRLVVFGDCMNTRLISTNAIHTLVGNDYASIEAKGRQAFAGKIFAKVIVGSNYAPEIDATANQISRLIYLTVRPLPKDDKGMMPAGDDATFEDRLVAEMPALLSKARRVYEEKCPNHGRIYMSDRQIEEMLTRTKSDIQEYIEQFCANNLVLEDEAHVACGDLNNFFMYSAKMSGLNVNPSLDVNLLNRYIEEKMLLEKDRVSNGRGLRQRVWKGARMSTQFEAYIKEKVIA